MDKRTKQRLGDGKINTSAEMIDAEEEKLWDDIKKSGQNNPYEIYDKYLKIFNEDV